MVADFRSSQQSSRSHPGPAIRDARCATKSFSRNILHVSTFATKILPRPHTSPLQWIQRFSWIPDGSTSAFFLLASAFLLLSPVFSRFYPQVLSIQRFCSCLPAKLMIPKDRRERGCIPRERVSPKFVLVTPLRSRFYRKVLSIQNFARVLAPTAIIYFAQ